MSFLWAVRNSAKIAEALLTEPRDLTPEQILFLPKNHIYRFTPAELEHVFLYLPKKYQTDSQILIKLPCYKHYTRGSGAPPPSRLACGECDRERSQARYRARHMAGKKIIYYPYCIFQGREAPFQSIPEEVPFQSIPDSLRSTCPFCIVNGSETASQSIPDDCVSERGPASGAAGSSPA